MERKRVSALSLYQSLSRGAAAHTPGDAAPAQKHRKKENGVQEKLKHDVKKKKKKTQQQKARAVKRESAEAECVCVSAVLTDLMRLSNSRERADRLFQWLLHPVQEQDFFRDNWEKKPIVIQRRNRGYYSGLFSTAELDAILRSEEVQYGVNLDVTSYRDGRRETHNPAGRALPYSVWDFYEGGCSLRMLNPQAFSSTVWQVLSILQEKFGSMAGANVYLTPPGTQGFAPHYDDIEAFIVQLEGKKHWRVYAPRSADETLPLVSSPNFSQAEIGRPVMEVLLEAGDLLYLPRGFIHQGECQADAHSLHITISTYQRNSWGDLLLKLVPAALGVAMEEEVEFRKGLPLDYLQFMGVQNSEKVDVRRERFLAHTRGLMKKLLLYAPVDAAVDQKARDVMHELLPPALSSEETSSSVCGAPARWRDGETRGVSVPLQGETRIRLIRAGAARLCSDGDAVSLFYTTENSRVYHKDDARSLEIQSQHIDAVELLIHSYPDFVSVASLPCDSMEAKVSLTELLFQRGLIHTDRALTACPAQ